MFYYFGHVRGRGALTLVLTAIWRSKFGFALRCIKQNEQAARTVGIDTLTNQRCRLFVPQAR